MFIKLFISNCTRLLSGLKIILKRSIIDVSLQMFIYFCQWLLDFMAVTFLLTVFLSCTGLGGEIDYFSVGTVSIRKFDSSCCDLGKKTDCTELLIAIIARFMRLSLLWVANCWNVFSSLTIEHIGVCKALLFYQHKIDVHIHHIRNRWTRNIPWPEWTILLFTLSNRPYANKTACYEDGIRAVRLQVPPSWNL